MSGYANSNRQILAKSNEIFAAGKNDGLMNPEQAKRFILDAQQGSEFLQRMRMEMRTVPKGKIEKMGIGGRLLRKQTEGDDVITGNGVVPTLGSVEYSCEDLVLGWEMSNKFLKENIEQRGFMGTWMGQIARQIGLDMLDAAWNCDKDTDESDPDYNFLKNFNGYIKQLATGSNILDASTINSGIFSPEMFVAAAKLLPKQYSRGNYTWIANENTRLTWIQCMQKRGTAAGDAAILGSNAMNPLGKEWSIIPNLPENVIIYGDPKNFALVTTYDVQTRVTDQGKEAVFRDMVFGATRLNMDPIIIEKKAVVMITNVPDTVTAA